VNSEILKALSKDDLVALILAQQVQTETQAVQISALTARIVELEARLDAPRKTPGNSSTPPSKGQKPSRPERPKKPRRGRPGVTRALAAHPDRIIEATLAACPYCASALGPADQPDLHAYDHIDLPPISPVVTRINRHRGVCPCCRKRVAAPVPDGFEPGSPFGPGLCALIIHLHVTQAIGFERLVCLLSEVFGLTPGISHQATGIWLRMSARTRTSSTASRMVWRTEFLPVTMRTALSATRLSVARLRGPWSRRTSDASSLMVTSRTQCRLFSTVQ